MDKSIQKITLYRYFDSQDRLLYVGITGDNTKRQSQHRRNSFWFGEITRATFEHFDFREDADEAESNAIRQEKPMHNIAKRGMQLEHSPYIHMLYLAGQPDGGHDTLHRDFCVEYSKLFTAANGNVPEADMVIVLAMQFARVDVDTAPNLTKCELCIKAYKSEWFEQTFKRLKGKW
jgi:predicted GIY-YIG superfamily endonuclease